jgi:H/ACA ribonucleoprotein complex subunit 2
MLLTLLLLLRTGLDYDELCTRVSVISTPLAGKKLAKKLYKGCGKAAKAKILCRGVKEVGKALRKGKKG